MISRSWFGRSNGREPDENAATAHPPRPQPLTPTREGTGPDPVSPGSPGSAQPSAADRTAPSADKSTHLCGVAAEMDGMSEQELLDFLERQVRHFGLRHYFCTDSHVSPL